MPNVLITISGSASPTNALRKQFPKFKGKRVVTIDRIKIESSNRLIFRVIGVYPSAQWFGVRWFSMLEFTVGRKEIHRA